MPMSLPRRALLAAPALAVLPRAAQAAFPDRPIRMIVPYTAGGSTDAQMRALCEAASRQFRQSVVVENRAGGGGIMGAQVAAGVRPDGYTLAQMPIGVFRHPHMVARPSFDPLVDFTWVIQVTSYLFGVVVRADAPYRTLPEMIEAARKDPGGVTYATTGVGSSMHITMQTIAEKAGVEWTHVPFRGSAESLQSLLGGQISAVATSSDWARMVRDGQVRLLFTCGATRARGFPDVPTLTELGFPIIATSPYGLAGPRGIPAEVTTALHDGFRAALEDPAYRSVLDRLDMQSDYLSTEAYTASAREQFAAERDVVRRFNLRGGD